MACTVSPQEELDIRSLRRIPGNKKFAERTLRVKSILTRVSGPNASDIVVLPPMTARVPWQFRNVIFDPTAYGSILAQIQIFRGRIYLEDAAITPGELTPDGRHLLPIDKQSWHVISIDRTGEITGCLRFLEESAAVRFDDLWLRGAAVARGSGLGPEVRRAVEEEMARARKERVRFGEVGGWAISEQRRYGSEALRIVLSTYGLLQLLGDCIGLATATVRHGSAEILRKIGLSSLYAGDTPVAPYYEPQYGCLMEMLRFDSRRANGRFMGWIDELRSHLTTASVFAWGQPATVFGMLNAAPAEPVPVLARGAVA